MRPPAARFRASRRSKPPVRRSSRAQTPCRTCGPVAQEAGWTGLLVDEEHGGAELEAFDAMLVLGECGRVLAGVPLLGHLPATALLAAVGRLRRARRSWRPARSAPATSRPAPRAT